MLNNVTVLFWFRFAVTVGDYVKDTFDFLTYHDIFLNHGPKSFSGSDGVAPPPPLQPNSNCCDLLDKCFTAQ